MRPIKKALGWALFGWCLLALGAWGQTFSARLVPTTVHAGESTKLSLVFQGTRPQAVPNISAPGFQVQYLGHSSSVDVNNGKTSEQVLLNYSVTPPPKPGDYTFPAVTAAVNGQQLQSKPITLKVIPFPAIDPEGPSLRLVLPKKEWFYVGEAIPVEVELYVEEATELRAPELNPSGFSMGRIDPQQMDQRRLQFNERLLNLVAFHTFVVPARAGQLTLGPATLGLAIPRPNSARDVFGRPDWQRVTLQSDAPLLDVRPLPSTAVPPGFAGAVGQFNVFMSVSPTNVAAGDPITVRITVAGRGILSGLTLPDQPAWKDFKVYPASGRTETNDNLGLEGSRIFEQVVVPENAGITELPPFQFSYFDPERHAYQSSVQPAVALVVRPGQATAQPTILAPSNSEPAEKPVRDIAHIRAHPGELQPRHRPMVQERWFQGALVLPPLLWLISFAWQRRQSARARNPALQRQRRVAQLVKSGLQELSHQAKNRQAEAFFATTFRLLQEQLGERLHQPASAITEAVLEEQVRPRGAMAPETLQLLHDLFQACNQARYARQQSAQELESYLPRVRAGLEALKQLPGPTTVKA